MNCASARQELLGSERPERPGEQLGAHLAGCRPCSVLQRRLARVEHDIRRLGVPKSAPPPELFARVLGPTPRGVLVAPAAAARQPGLRGRGQPAEGGAGVRAGGVVGGVRRLLVGVAATRDGRRLAAPPGVRQDSRGPAARGSGPRDGVERLTKLAEDWLAVAPKADDAALADLARQFEWLMQHDLPYQAGKVGADERAAVLGKVAGRLQQMESEASRLAARRGGSREASRSLGRIVAAVQEGDRRVRLLSEARG